MSLEEWEEYVAVKRVRAWGKTEEEWVSSLPPGEQDLVYELAARLNVTPVDNVEQDRSGVGSPETRRGRKSASHPRADRPAPPGSQLF